MAPKAKTVKNVEKAAPTKPKKEVVLQSEDMALLQENLTALTQALAALSATVEAHVQKTANIASHVIAVEEMISEIISVTGINLADVNNHIRKRIVKDAIDAGAADLAIDCAATIATRRVRI
ncbi:MAG: hypothetical protein LBV07_03845 [Syntrophobacterales bacterium]|jgi:primosomal protein N''|nr:hypothetical protein [Syntrophobacterales bacterium]